MSNTVYKVFGQPGDLTQKDLEQNYGPDMTFKVTGGALNSDAPVIRQLVDEINKSKRTQGITVKINNLIGTMIDQIGYSEVSIELQPDKTTKVCQVIVHPSARKTNSFEFNLLGRRPNYFQFSFNNFNFLNNYENTKIGRKYCFENKSDTRFFHISFPLPKFTSIDFHLAARNQQLNESVKQNSIRTRLDYKINYQKADHNVTDTYSIGMTERGNSMKKYTNPSDLLRSQVYKLKMKRACQFSTHERSYSVSGGMDPIRKQFYTKLYGSISGYTTFGNKSQFMSYLNFRGGAMAGENIALNDEFNYRECKGRARMFVSAKYKLYLRNHPIFAGLNIAPYSYIEGWLSKEKSLSIRNFKKQAEVGIGFYINPLRLGIEFGLLDIQDQKMRSSSKFRISLDT